MNIFNQFKSLLKKKNNKSISNISNILYIPKLNEIHNKNFENTVLSYITEYTKKLSNSKTLTSLNLTAEELNNKINMCTNIILNICLENDLDNHLFSLYKSNFIISAKLKYYENTILENKSEIFARLIAIKHIFDTKFLTPNKKRKLKIIYENLIISYSIISAQIFSIKSIIENYINNIKNEDIDFNLNIYINNLYPIAETIIPKIYNKIINSEISETSKIVSLEIALEQYIYDNNNLLIKLFDENLYSIENMKKQEIMLKSLVYYGRGYIKNEDIVNFYRKKFYFLCTIVDENNFNDLFNVENLEPIEYKIYEEELYKKIEKMVNGTSIELIDLPYTYKIKCIKILKKIFKSNGTYEITNILKNYSLFNLLISLDKKDGINNFFDQYLINVNDLSNIQLNNTNDISINLEDKINFKCLNFYLKFLNIKNKNNLFNSKLPVDFQEINNNLYELYNTYENSGKASSYIFDTNKQINYYKLPEGIKKLILNKDSHNNTFVKNLMENNGLIFPSTLIEFKNNNCKQHLILNDKLELLILDDWIDEVLEIPSKLTIITISNRKNIKVIKFKDFKNNLLLKNTNNFYIFMHRFYTFKKVEKNVSLKYISYDYFFPHYESTNTHSPSILSYNELLEEYSYKTDLEKIIFESIDKTITIPNNLLCSKIIIPREAANLFNRPKVAFLEVIKKILNIIKENSGYNAYNENNKYDNMIENKIYRKRKERKEIRL